MCCLIFSRRGLAYFGVLVQLFVALLIIPIVTILIAFTGTGKWRTAIINHHSVVTPSLSSQQLHNRTSNIENMTIVETVRPNGHGSTQSSAEQLSNWEIAFVFTYCGGLCFVAVLAFKGIRSGALTFIYASIIALLFLQIGACAALHWFLISSPNENLAFEGFIVSGNDNDAMIRLIAIAVNLVSTSLYLVVLTWVAFRLRRTDKTEIGRFSCTTTDSEKDYRDAESDQYYLQNKP